MSQSNKGGGQGVGVEYGCGSDAPNPPGIICRLSQSLWQELTPGSDSLSPCPCDLYSPFLVHDFPSDAEDPAGHLHMRN
jgi:hypothetical protein